ncbi:hypothetical protein BD560DRAFT_397837 [Blakeslea trispora]|nr:hypothetical protein BD560DRAFT_397837 [Blakeslea trispora]
MQNKHVSEEYRLVCFIARYGTSFIGWHSISLIKTIVKTCLVVLFIMIIRISLNVTQTNKH